MHFLAVIVRGTRTAAGEFAPNGRRVFRHRLSGGHELRQRVRPFPGGSLFRHQLTGGHELPQAGSPLTGGEFFAEPQRGVR